MMKTFCNLCRKPQIIKSKYLSTFIGTIFVYISIAFIVPVGNFSVYITSYIHNSGQEFVTLHYGAYFSLIFTFSMTFSRSLGGMLEPKLGFMGTTLLGLLIIIFINIFFFRVANIYVCYLLIVLMGIGAGIATSLVQKNLTFYNPKKKGRISGILGILTIVLASLFAFSGERIINNKPWDIDPKTQVYGPECSERTYIYYLAGFTITPVGAILSYLFLYEYQKDKDPAFMKNNLLQKEMYDLDENSDLNSNQSEELKADISPKTPEQKEKERSERNFEKEVDKLRQKRHVKRVIKSGRFWRISIACLFFNFPTMFMINTGRIIGAILGINARALQIMSLFQAVGMLFFGPIFGFISDKTSPLTLLRIVTIICIIPGIILYFFLDNTFAFLASAFLLILGFVGNLVGAPPLAMEIYGIQESVMLGSIMATFSKISEIVTTISAFSVSFIYPGNSIRIPYKIMYILCSFFSYASFYLFMLEDIDKYQYDDSDINVEQTEISRESLLSNL